MIEDEEHERLDALLGTLQRKDEVQQRMEAITQLAVTAWRCATCDSTTDKRRPSCQVGFCSRAALAVMVVFIPALGSGHIRSQS